MKKLFTLLLLAAASHASAEVQISDAWARFTVQGQQAGGVFMTLSNTGNQAERLLGGRSPVARKVEIHTHTMHEGRMRMEELTNGLTLAAGSQEILRPGGLHVMLIGLKQPLTAGQTFPLTLRFANGKTQTVQVQVRRPSEEAAQHGHDHHHGHQHDHSHGHHGHNHQH